MSGSKSLADYQRDYLRLRRAMGHALTGYDRLLTVFVAEVTADGQNMITVDAAVRWASAPADAMPLRRAARLAVVRGLANYIHSRDPGRAELIADDLIPARVTRTVPYIYNADQVQALMAAALMLRPILRGLTLSTVIGLMAATGIRISECLALDAGDVDTGDNVLTVTGKRGRRRLVPIHPSTTGALSDYRRASSSLVARADAHAFFLTFQGTRPHAGNVEAAFRGLTVGLGYHPRPGGKMPRLHDMRHSFASNALVRAYADGVDVDARVAVLATYLGHVSPASTYWYLTATPELMNLAAGKIAAAQQAGRLL